MFFIYRVSIVVIGICFYKILIFILKNVELCKNLKVKRCDKKIYECYVQVIYVRKIYLGMNEIFVMEFFEYFM